MTSEKERWKKIIITEKREELTKREKEEQKNKHWNRIMLRTKVFVITASIDFTKEDRQIKMKHTANIQKDGVKECVRV